MNPLIQLKKATPVFLVALTCFAFSPIARAVNPPPDGGYPSQNTAEGDSALFSLTTGIDNTAIGFNALFSNTTGGDNTVNGVLALALNTTGSSNTANGFQALINNTTGSNNIALGANAGANLTTGGNNIEFGNAGVAGESATIRIGTTGTQTKTFIAGIHGIAVVSGTAVKVNAVGQLGTLPSSKRFKDQIKPMDKTSEVIYLLKPVTFQYKKELDPNKTPQFGLIAEEVEEVNPDLVDRDAQGKVYTVRYEAVDAMLLNEFLKEHRKVEQLEKQIEALTAGLQKVSAQIEMSRPTSQTVLNSR